MKEPLDTIKRILLVIGIGISSFFKALLEIIWGFAGIYIMLGVMNYYGLQDTNANKSLLELVTLFTNNYLKVLGLFFILKFYQSAKWEFPIIRKEIKGESSKE